jgi:hypothetical protein
VADDHHGATPPVASDPPGGGISSLQGRSDATRTVLNPSTTHPKETSAKADAPPAELVPIRQDVERICNRLADRIEQNGSKRPKITARWRDAARLLIDKDGKTEQQISTAIDWCQSDDFWRANVLSLPTLRDKYDRLRLDAKRQHDRAGGTVDDHLLRAAQRMGATQ